MKAYVSQRASNVSNRASVNSSKMTGPQPNSSPAGNARILGKSEHARSVTHTRVISNYSMSVPKYPAGTAAFPSTAVSQPRSVRIYYAKVKQPSAGANLTTRTGSASAGGSEPMKVSGEASPLLHGAVNQSRQSEGLMQVHTMGQDPPDSQTHNSSVMLGCILENLALFFSAKQIAVDRSLLHGGKISMTQLASAFEAYVVGLPGVNGRPGFGKDAIRKTFTNARSAYAREAVAPGTRRG